MVSLTVTDIFQAFRPKTLPASISPILIALAITYKSYHFIDIPIAIFTILVAVLLQISTNLVNDYFDAKSGVDQHRSHGPKRISASNPHLAEQIKRIFLLTFFLAFLFVIPLLIRGQIVMLLLTFLCFSAAYFYTAGPYPLSHLGLGELLAFTFFGPIATWGTIYLQNPLLIETVSANIVIQGIPTGLISAMIMSINNTRDRYEDQLKGKKTLSVVLPTFISNFLPLIFLSLSIIATILIFFPCWPTLLISFLPVAPFLLHWIFLSKIKYFNTKSWPGTQFNLALAATGQYMFLHALLTATFIYLNQSCN